MYFNTVLSGSLGTSVRRSRSHSIALPRRLHWRFACFTLRADNVPGRSTILLLTIEWDCLSRATLAEDLAKTINVLNRASIALLGRWMSAQYSLWLHRCFMTTILQPWIKVKVF